VFEVDVTVCPDSGGKMKMLSAITEPRAIRKFLAYLGLPTKSPATELARGPPRGQLALDIAEDDVA
jgi:hypothetical protein